MSSQKTIRIGNAGGYWGDDPKALARQIRGGSLDYVTMDFLAEVTMSIMQKQRARDPNHGYAKDFIHMLDEILPEVLSNKTKIITNAGGVNPTACAQAIEALGKKHGVSPKIAVVYGDDILGDIAELKNQGAKFTNMENGANFAEVEDRMESANLYFGASPVVEALKWDPDIIITGRVTDTGITVAAMIHEFGWSLDDWDKMAAGTVAGHLLECGSQATGGNFTDWKSVEDFTDMGYPIVEVSADGTFVLTKHDNTGGLVSRNTAREQLFYEMGSPSAYITPDVVCDFGTIQAEELGDNRVRIHGVKGVAPTPFYKVSMAYRDGFKATGSIMISGPAARAKSEKFAEIFWKRVDQENLIESSTEYIGWNACHRSLVHRDEANEVLLRLGARSSEKGDLRAFGKSIPALILSGPPGVAVIGGVPSATEVVGYWPALIDKNLVQPKIALLKDGKLTDEKVVTEVATGSFTPQENAATSVAKSPNQSVSAILKESQEGTELAEICLARSGDKGDMVNIGLLARSPKAYVFIKENVTAQVVKNFFQELCFGPVERFELDNLEGLNFLLDQSLGGGGTVTLRTDAQGKTFSQALLRQKFQIPQDVLAEARGEQ